MSEPTQLLDLPVDIIYLILPYLDVTSFVSLTSTCTALHQPDLAQHAPYWSSAARQTFRVPNQPVVENDGLRWQKMYRRLLTESRCFTWGNNDRMCLGHGHEQHMGSPFGRGGIGPAGRRRPILRARQHVSWPTEMENMKQLGIIADMQCGGWSTNFLTSKGGLYSVGVMDGFVASQPAKSMPERLRYPAGLPHPSERYEPASAIKQFSAGRGHVLALSDSGYIWSWSHINLPALQVKFLDVDTMVREGVSPSARGYVKKVVAGWAKSAALIVGTGIVVWHPLARSPRQPAGEEDAVLVMETAICPGTDFQRHATTFEPSSAGITIGEVLNFICLEHYIVFNTHLGKVYVARIVWDAQSKALDGVRELQLGTEGETKFATDVQGSFRSFAIFTSDGTVYTGNQDDHLQHLFHPLHQDTVKPLDRIHALQQTQVISMAFGDYHFHALHAPGYITSYGTEPKSCGSLGLGGHGDPEGRIRGLRYQGIGGDGRLVPHASLHGRRVWFEKEKQKWITFLTSGGRDPEEARERMRMLSELNVQGEVSEWVEQEGNAWEQKFGETDNAQSSDALGTYFALNITAAGWHSGSLVLVNEDKAKRINGRAYVWAQDSFPRLKLANGEEMPGEIEFSAWRNGRPQWEGKIEGY
ncbi:RCC1/BLIP-II protein [Aureobasidium namibiae CBS 147.97]|uniref:RCC1/BLIP-II protein n=1 Tax=Aureobasidium namibiae CBS 147.97 TaxID=1043004 RepID=A0A074WL67_9PEZI|nr:RCC1/BLIP-II protein [Aureobasidium namibiae CBS 147.97]KEQ73858.1 RCC1/BLIP-II protein [Aureobasidium namibiae CBS 147.97]